ncbi:hypothetical protein IC757_00180 [Wenzhouxiangella sp. AB-CW3]|uniref:hypothetical protein n=1 Tax=Wenzhouxiangella sp. AB-CW3 TaxID=2771012 RepID=UPI00168B4C8D|nr:hypothetical protein [Wenzhouxiangella sp. AB-CW3]QOC22634.1 hypothetical protein IC757_00180 [Wenzhouxiangella sp. AB-CW3]
MEELEGGTGRELRSNSTTAVFRSVADYTRFLRVCKHFFVPGWIDGMAVPGKHPDIPLTKPLPRPTTGSAQFHLNRIDTGEIKTDAQGAKP